jgi:hypothetical protein
MALTEVDEDEIWKFMGLEGFKEELQEQGEFQEYEGKILNYSGKPSVIAAAVYYTVYEESAQDEVVEMFDVSKTQLRNTCKEENLRFDEPAPGNQLDEDEMIKYLEEKYPETMEEVYGGEVPENVDLEAPPSKGAWQNHFGSMEDALKQAGLWAAGMPLAKLHKEAMAYRSAKETDISPGEFQAATKFEEELDIDVSAERIGQILNGHGDPSYFN